jgi:transcriptional regulator with XRE-family HTH domain
MEKNTEIKEFRKFKGWSQKDLADQLGTNVMTISRWESGKIPKTKSSAWHALNKLVSQEPAE